MIKTDVQFAFRKFHFLFSGDGTDRAVSQIKVALHGQRHGFQTTITLRLDARFEESPDADVLPHQLRCGFDSEGVSLPEFCAVEIQRARFVGPLDDNPVSFQFMPGDQHRGLANPKTLIIAFPANLSRKAQKIRTYSPLTYRPVTRLGGTPRREVNQECFTWNYNDPCRISAKASCRKGASMHRAWIIGLVVVLFTPNLSCEEPVRQNEFLSGATVYPEILTPEQRTRMLDELQRAHFNVLRVGESSWGSLETAPGVYSFGSLREFLDELARRKMQAILGTATYLAPFVLSFRQNGRDQQALFRR